MEELDVPTGPGNFLPKIREDIVWVGHVGYWDPLRVCMIADSWCFSEALA